MSLQTPVPELDHVNLMNAHKSIKKPKKSKFGRLINSYNGEIAWTSEKPMADWSGLEEPNPSFIKAGRKHPTYMSDEPIALHVFGGKARFGGQARLADSLEKRQS